jgi:hypothetical protein
MRIAASSYIGSISSPNSFRLHGFGHPQQQRLQKWLTGENSAVHLWRLAKFEPVRMGTVTKYTS